MLQGAQRLSASTEQTASTKASRLTIGHVLNAFRHQRNKQSSYQCIDNAPAPVLNAFRHQRNKQLGQLVDFVAIEKCSTPFGINGTNSRQQLDEPLNTSVLNAFRHQRNKQPFGVAFAYSL